MLATLVLLTSLTEFMAQQVTERLGAGVDREPQQETYQGHSIRFTHQYWRIQTDSICADRQQQPDYAPCRQQALALFTDYCQRLSRGSPEEQESPRRAMYCAAAESSTTAVSAAEPTAPIADPTPATPEIELQRGRRECNRLRFKAMLSDDPALRQQRDQVCAEQPQKGGVFSNCIIATW